MLLEYVQDLGQAFAIPILEITEYAGLTSSDLCNDPGGFHPPQVYVRLTQHPELLAVCAKLTTSAPVRHMTVRPR